MPSRKRAKGKERKAAVALRSRPRWERLARWGEEHDVKCSHGVAVIPGPGHPLRIFLDNHFGEMMTNLDVSHELGEILVDDTNRKMLHALLISIGTNVVLSAKPNESDWRLLGVGPACKILLIEQYGQTRDLDAAKMGVAVIGGKKLVGVGDRELLQFYCKRLPCSCLKKRYSDAKKSLPKQGACRHCKKHMDRKALLLCSGCRVAAFCSVECQRAEWVAGHKKECHILARFQEYGISQE